MAKHDVSTTEMDELLPGEREALADGTDGEETKTETAAEAAPAETPAEEAKTEEAKPEELKPEETPVAETPAAAPAVATSDDDDVADTPIAVLLEKNDDYQAKLKELGERFDGSEDMTTAQLLQEQQKLTAEYTDMALADQAWDRQCREFMRDHPEISPKTSQAMFDAFNQAVIRLGSDEAHAGKSPGYYLRTAYAQIAEQIPGLKSAEPKPKPSTEPRARTERGPVPTSLAGVPAAAPADVGDGEFAELERLMYKDPLAYEMAIAAMSEEKARRYLEGA